MHSVFRLHKALSVNILWENGALVTAIMVELRPWTMKNKYTELETLNMLRILLQEFICLSW